jgi:hypothetical protein
VLLRKSFKRKWHFQKGPACRQQGLFKPHLTPKQPEDISPSPQSISVNAGPVRSNALIEARTMRTRILCLTASAFLAASALAGRADSYTFTISTAPTSTTPGTAFVVSGTLTGTPVPSNPGNPAIELTSITGASQGYNFTGVVPLGANTSFAYDNLVFTDPNAIHVDAQGDLLTLSSPIGTSLAHVYNNGTYHVDVFDPNDPVDVTPFTIDSFILTPTPTAVPEPSSFLLLGIGIFAFALAAATRKIFPRFH